LRTTRNQQPVIVISDHGNHAVPLDGLFVLLVRIGHAEEIEGEVVSRECINKFERY
jgi:hypothetical protein